MKIFSSLVAFAMVFACLSVAFADVALPPRPRDVQSSFVTADITDDGELSLKFEFPYECKYEYRLIDVWENRDKEIRREEILSGKGKCKSGKTVEGLVNVKKRLWLGRNFFLLQIQLSDIKEKTRFGTKTRRGKEDVTKTIVVSFGTWGQIYDLRVYDGDQTVSR